MRQAAKLGDNDVILWSCYARKWTLKLIAWRYLQWLIHLSTPAKGWNRKHANKWQNFSKTWFSCQKVNNRRISAQPYQWLSKPSRIPNSMFPAKFDCSTHTYTPSSQQKQNSVNHLHAAPMSRNTLCRPHRHEKTVKQLVSMLWGIKWCKWGGKQKHIHSQDSTEPDVMPGVFSRTITTLLECHWTSWHPSPSW